MKKTVNLFPLTKISLQTGIQRPLNIFEPRYLRMIEDSIQTETPVALVYGKSELESGDISIEHEIFSFIKPVAGFGLPRLIQKSDDGSMVIMLPGEGKARITKIVTNDKPYLTAEYEIINEVQKLECENVLLMRRLSTCLEKWICSNVKMQGQKDVLLGHLNEPCRIVGLYVELLIACPDTKQKVLEIDDINEKIQYLALM